MSVDVPAVLPERLMRARGDPMEGAENTSIVRVLVYLLGIEKRYDRRRALTATP